MSGLDLAEVQLLPKSGLVDSQDLDGGTEIAIRAPGKGRAKSPECHQGMALPPADASDDCASLFIRLRAERPRRATSAQLLG